SSRPARTGRRWSGPGSSRRRCSAPTTAGGPSPWSRGCGAPPPARAGARGAPRAAGGGGRPDRLYLQNHWGLYRSDDGGDHWRDMANGVPSDFGFPMVAHPRDPDTAWIIPLDSDQFRCTPDGQARVYRTRDAGDSWAPLTEGLPERDAWLTVLRDGFATDGLEPAGLYFGTRTGQLFASS